MEHLKDIPAQLIFMVIAIAGGVARYLTGYANGTPFKFSILIAASLAAGFSGMMFYYVGVALNLPVPFLAMMAGTGGFYGEQTMKLVLEYASRNLQKPEKKT